jgi:hypothetical protein
MIYASGSENPGSSSEAASFAQHDQVCLPAKSSSTVSFGPAAPATRAERTTGMVRFSEIEPFGYEDKLVSHGLGSDADDLRIWEREPGQ